MWQPWIYSSILCSLQSYFLSTSSISITTLQGMDCSLTDNEGRHIQKTQIAHLRFVTGLGLDLKSPTLMQLPETDTSQPIQLQSRRQAGKCLTKSEALRAFFRLSNPITFPATASNLFPGGLSLSLCSSYGTTHKSQSKYQSVCHCLLGVCFAQGESTPCGHFLPSHSDVLSLPAFPLSGSPCFSNSQRFKSLHTHN